jgi:hypothetical protein
VFLWEHKEINGSWYHEKKKLFLLFNKHREQTKPKTMRVCCWFKIFFTQLNNAWVVLLYKRILKREVNNNKEKKMNARPLDHGLRGVIDQSFSIPFFNLYLIPLN